jgi:hypothetical protein
MKTKGDDDNGGSMESQRGTQAHPMMMMQSGGSMTNNQGGKCRLGTPGTSAPTAPMHKEVSARFQT